MHSFPQIAAPYCYRCPFELQHPQCGIECARELAHTIEAEDPDTVSAFIAEPIIGTTVSGVVPPPEYYRIIREICDKYGVLFIADEVITGIGRTGRNFGMDHWRIAPDISVAGKGLAAGYAPLSAVIVSKKVFNVIAAGSGKHTQGFTYGSNPLSCSAGLAVLNYIESNRLVQRSREIGHYLRNGLEALKDTGVVGDIRGKGLLQGIEFVANQEDKRPFPAPVRLTERIVSTAFRMGLILISGLPGCADGVNGDHIQISPPFVITEAQIDEAIETIRQAIKCSLDAA
jgi:adenosylmethionine-8-amino-7-oxononanoate aminotransferase